jgi:3-methyladenine DNA glycosylase AlkD
MNITEELFKLQDKDYADFISRLTPGIHEDSIIGVRLPVLRKLAAFFYKDPEHLKFLEQLPHKYYNENLLHSILLSKEKDYDICMKEVEDFLPYIDNWAVCDTLSPKIFEKNKSELLIKVRNWVSSDRTYTCRFGIGMLMRHFLDRDFLPEYLSYPAEVHSDEYYVKMMVAWLYATALAKQWDETLPYIQSGKLDKWIHNKTIQKAVESFRIPDDRKELLKKFRQK